MLPSKIENIGRGKMWNKDHAFRFMQDAFKELISWSYIVLGLRREAWRDL